MLEPLSQHTCTCTCTWWDTNQRHCHHGRLVVVLMLLPLEPRDPLPLCCLQQAIVAGWISSAFSATVAATIAVADADTDDTCPKAPAERPLASASKAGLQHRTHFQQRTTFADSAVALSRYAADWRSINSPKQIGVRACKLSD
jgi:hypothetical protein